jgi:hypothetical protein
MDCSFVVIGDTEKMEDVVKWKNVFGQGSTKDNVLYLVQD